LAATLRQSGPRTGAQECAELAAACGLVIVFDDFHKLSNDEVIEFICLFSNAARACSGEQGHLPLFILSRISPQSAAGAEAGLLLQPNSYSLLQGIDLDFTYSELEKLLHANDIALSTLDQQDILDATAGWAWAVARYVLSLTRNGQAGFQAEAVRQSVIGQLEDDVISKLSARACDVLVGASLIAISEPCVEEAIMTSCRTLNSAESWQALGFMSFDNTRKVYAIKPLLLSYLRSRQHLLSLEERQHAFRCSAYWCLEHGSLQRAVYYFAQLNDYEQMLDILLEYPLMPNQTLSRYCMEILDSMEMPASPKDDPKGCLVLMKETFSPRYLVNLGRYEEAEQRLLGYIAKWEELDKQQRESGEPVQILVKIMLFSLNSCMAYCRLHSCTLTHVYDFANWAEKSKQIFAEHPFAIRGAGNGGYATMRSFACYVGAGAKAEEFDEFVREVREMTSTAYQVAVQGMYSGYDELCNCEIAFYRGDLEGAKRAASEVCAIAASQGQFEVEASAIFYLVKIAIFDGDSEAIEVLLARLEAQSQKPEFLQGQAVYGFALAIVYAQLNILSLIPPWMKSASFNENAQLTMRARDNLVRARCLIATRNYNEALAILQLPSFSAGDGLFLFTQLLNTLFSAIARFRIGDMPGALAGFERAYSLSQGGALVTPFIEHGHYTRALIKLALGSKSCSIPQAWLADVEKRASAYVKKSAAVAGVLKKEHGLKDSISLSERESQLLNDVCKGLTREEIAVTRYISINTVKSELKTLYAKLGVNSGVEMMRVALEHDLLSDFNKLLR
jgi:LuxR family maltose regulon positive regulatory protein